MLKLVFCALFVTMTAHADLNTDKTSINNDCKTDAKVAGCGDKTMGHGLAKCIWGYRQKNPKFTLSEKCKADMMRFRKDRAEKGHRKNMPPNGATPAQPPAPGK